MGKFVPEKKGNCLKVSGGKLKETPKANYFSALYRIDCAVLSAKAECCQLYGRLLAKQDFPGSGKAAAPL